MIHTLLGTKKHMDQQFVDMNRVPVTIIQAGPCVVTQVKTQEKDGYVAVQLGFGEKSLNSITKPLKGHLKGAITEKKAPRFLGEVIVDEGQSFKVGDIVKLTDVFTEGDIVTITGTSKGKGFQGVMKRWGFAGGNRSHGQHGTKRAPGSIGQGTSPGRVRKGKKMGGRMGGDTITVTNLKVMSLNPDRNEMAVSGTLPGSRGSMLIIKRIKKAPQIDAVSSQETQQSINSDEKGETTE